ncbi:MAG: putative branched-chain amino acid transport ATP-binding protein LivG [Candidatus Heimdallarchaeota archaeon LC_3]|nr:MAG: putative branched-chain amino acid transport ATP-binding protein LivG [Candidatus Heimdallarchaeota archaeon LC_3]
MLNVDKKSEDGFQVLRDTDLSLKREKISVILILSVFVIVMWLISPKIATEGLLWAIIYGLLALSLNYQSGHSGITNFGVVGFFAIGAYVTSILSLMNWHWALALLFGMLISALFTFIISIPTLRLREDYFAIFTITFGEIIRLVFQAEEWFVYPPNPPDEKFYGGTKGLVVGNEIVRDIGSGILVGIALLVTGITFFILLSNFFTKFLKRKNFSLLLLFANIFVGGFFILLTLGVIGSTSGMWDWTLSSLLLDTFSNFRSFLLDISVPESFLFNIYIPNWFNFNLELGLANIFLIDSVEADKILFVAVCVISLILMYLLLERIYNSPLGRINKAIREDDLAVESLGINVYKQRVLAMSFGTLPAGLAGGLFAFFLGSTHPQGFLPILTFFVWTMMVVGGFANNRGVIVGAFVYGASIPLIVNLKDDISALFGSLMKPLAPEAAEGLMNDFGLDLSTISFLNIKITFILSILLLIVFVILSYFYERKRNERFLSTKVFGLILLVTYLPIILKDVLNFLGLNIDIVDLFILNIDYFGYLIFLILLGLIFAFNYYETNKGSMKYLTSIFSFLFIFSFIPVVLSNLFILPKLDFDFFSNLTGITYVSFSEFFITLDPFLARDMTLGIILILFLLFRPDGIIKERKIRTTSSMQAYELYQRNKKKIEIENDKSSRSIDLLFNESTKNLPENILKTESLNKSFGGVSALDEVSIAVKKGVLLGIIGPNGSGKSTFFNVVSSILDQDRDNEGNVTFLDKNITTNSTHDIVQEGLGRTFQQARLFKNMTVLENLLVSPRNQKGSKYLSAILGNWKLEERELQQKAFQILEFLNILHIWNHKTSEISGGQQKLVSLGRSLMGENKLIMLDEPVAGVNPTLAKTIFEKIHSLQQQEKQNFVIIEHNMDVQLTYCDYLFVFNKGQIVAEGTPEEIKSNREVIEAYLGT